MTNTVRPRLNDMRQSAELKFKATVIYDDCKTDHKDTFAQRHRFATSDAFVSIYNQFPTEQ